MISGIDSSKMKNTNHKSLNSSDYSPHIRKRMHTATSETKKKSNEKEEQSLRSRKFRSRSPTPSFDEKHLNSGGRRKWRKVLYDRDPNVPDNYAPREFFLAAIERNKNLHKYSFGACVKGSAQVSLQVFAVLLLALSYLALAEKECSAFGNTCRHFLLLTIIGSCFIGYLFIFLSNTGSFQALVSANKRKISTLKNPKKLIWCGSVHPTESEPSHSLLIWSWYKAGFKQATIFITFGLALSPVLYKLTDTISTDTIYTMTTLVLLIHLIFHDYGLRSSFVSHPLSLNAGLFAAVCLASRLPTSFDAFVLLSASVLTFVLFPIFRRTQIIGLVPNVVSSICLCSLTIISSVSLSSCAFGLYAAVALIVIVLLCPALFIHWQNHKDTIHGPWDEAVPKFG